MKIENSPSESVTSTTSLSSSSSSSLVVGYDEVGLSAARWKGSATLGMLSRIGVVAKVSSGIGLVIKKPGATTLIQCNQGSLALMTHFGTWKLLEIEM